MLQKVESLPRIVDTVIAAKGDQLHINVHGFGMRCSASTYRRDVWVSTYFWPCTVILILVKYLGGE
uniref:Uncharacterized protein n=1 Tax=Anguilla anguilla TaxID=7936 RepID=A0A0E9W0I5_ANGAN